MKKFIIITLISTLLLSSSSDAAKKLKHHARANRKKITAKQKERLAAEKIYLAVIAENERRTKALESHFKLLEYKLTKGATLDRYNARLFNSTFKTLYGSAFFNIYDQNGQSVNFTQVRAEYWEPGIYWNVQVNVKHDYDERLTMKLDFVDITPESRDTYPTKYEISQYEKGAANYTKQLDDF